MNGASTAELREFVQSEITRALAQQAPAAARPVARRTVILVFSAEMDRVFTALAIANATVAMGGEATVFFSFWGTCALRGPAAGGGAKPFVERMLARVMPRGLGSLPLSRMNFGGAGAWFFRWWMRQKRMQGLEEMLDDARELGVRLLVCEMSMQVMGFQRDELIAGLEYGGVASFVGEAMQSATVMVI